MTEMTLSEALSEVGKYARMTKGLEKMGEVAQTLAGAEQAIAEKTALADTLQSRIDQLKTEAAEAQSAVDKAKATASDLLASAEGGAAALLANARTEAGQVKREADAAVQAAGIKLGEVKAELATVKAQIDSANKELEGTKARTAAALEAARKTFGG